MQGPDPDAGGSVGRARQIPLQLMVLGCWLIAFGASAVLEYAPHASLWFPPTAVTFAAVLVIGPRALPGLFMACIFVVALDRQFFAGGGYNPTETILTGLSFAVLHTGAYGALALLIRAGAQHVDPLSSFSRLNAFLLGGAIAAGIPAVLGALALDGLGSGDLEQIIVPRWIGDYAGLITVAPLMMILFAKAADHLRLPLTSGLRGLIRAELAQPSWHSAWPKLLGLALLTLGLLAFAALLPETGNLLFLLLLCLPVQFWLVSTESAVSGLIGVLLFTLLLAAAASLKPFGDQAMMLQFVVISLAIINYLGGLVPHLYRDNRRMRQLLVNDTLTGALTRKFFEDGARAGLRQSRLKQQTTCLVMVELAKLKQMNETDGHAAGDQALKAFSAVCQAQMDRGDLVGRLGGNRFALFLHDSDTARTQMLLEQIRQALTEGLAEPSGTKVAALGLGARFGVAAATPDSDFNDYTDLLKTADQAMHRGKLKTARQAD